MQTGKPYLLPNKAKRSHLATGFAYVLLLVAISVIGIIASSTLSLGSQLARRDAELSLLAIGMEFQKALRSYAAVPIGAAGATVNPDARGPRTLEELLKDPRAPDIRRHLRQIYADPMTGRDTWGLVKDPAGYILAVYSLAYGKPIKQTDFEPTLASFEAPKTYATWLFGLPNATLHKNTPPATTLRIENTLSSANAQRK